MSNDAAGQCARTSTRVILCGLFWVLCEVSLFLLFLFLISLFLYYLVCCLLFAFYHFVAGLRVIASIMVGSVVGIFAKDVM